VYLESQELPAPTYLFQRRGGELSKKTTIFYLEVFDNLIDSKQQTIRKFYHHDLRNPCAGIIMLIDLLKERKKAQAKEEIYDWQTFHSLAEQQLAIMESTLAI